MLMVMANIITTKMTSRAECKRCGSPVWLPPGTQRFQCSACGAISRPVIPLTNGLRYYTYPPPPNTTPYGGPHYTLPPPPPRQPYAVQYTPMPPQRQQFAPPPPQRQQFAPLPPMQVQRPQFSPPSPMVASPPRWVNGAPVAGYGRKKAVVCGINYFGKFKLEGSVNDAKNIRKLLFESFGFPPNSVWMLTDDDRDPINRPTKQNMVRALEWLVDDCKSGDSLVFFFSGHGSRVADENYDELDGYDEALCPLDFKTAGKLLDDEINEIIVKPLPPNVKLHAIIDTCFSGTVLDLQHVCKKARDGRYEWEYHGNPDKTTNGGLAICISACDDHQNSADTTAFSDNRADVAGALTHSFTKTLRKDYARLTYAHLLNIIDHDVRKARSSVTPNHQFDPQSFQEPQVSSSAQFDIYTKFTL